MKIIKKRLAILLILVAILVIVPTSLYFLSRSFAVSPLTVNEITLYKGNKDTVVIYPIFTQGAYSNHAFYAFYNHTCNSSCLTIQIPTKIIPSFNTGNYGYLYLKELHYTFITDVDVDKNPQILNQYNHVILLHNEYVTQNEFNAITNHSHVTYLYPNTLYAKINTDYSRNTMTLIRGHNYPSPDIRNGFDWKYDNSNNEYDIMCGNWHFTHISNGFQLSCYPDILISHDRNLLKQLKTN